MAIKICPKCGALRMSEEEPCPKCNYMDYDPIQDFETVEKDRNQDFETVEKDRNTDNKPPISGEKVVMLIMSIAFVVPLCLVLLFAIKSLIEAPAHYAKAHPYVLVADETSFDRQDDGTVIVNVIIKQNLPYKGETAIEPYLYFYADDGKYVTRSRTVTSSEYLGNNRWLCTVQVKDKRNRIARVLLHTCEAVSNDNSNTQNYISE